MRTINRWEPALFASIAGSSSGRRKPKPTAGVDAPEVSTSFMPRGENFCIDISNWRSQKQIFRVLAVFVSLGISSTLLAQTTGRTQTSANGPSLDVTIKFIADKLSESDEVRRTPNYLVSNESDSQQIPTFNVQDDMSFHFSGSAPACQIVRTETSLKHPQVNAKTTYDLSQIEKIKILSSTQAVNEMAIAVGHDVNGYHYKTDYPALLIQFKRPAVTDPDLVLDIKDDQWITRPPTEEERQRRVEAAQFARFSFFDEETAERVAKALTHAAELCGADGADSEPF